MSELIGWLISPERYGGGAEEIKLVELGREVELTEFEDIPLANSPDKLGAGEINL